MVEKKTIKELEKIDGLKITKLNEQPRDIKRIGCTITDTINTLWTRDILNFDLFLYDGTDWWQVE